MEPLGSVFSWLAYMHPHLAGLDHVVSTVSECLDVSVLLSPPKAAASGYVFLFQRVLSRLQLTQGANSILRFRWMSQAMQKAIEGGHFTTVKDIHEVHPEPLAVASFRVALRCGRTEILDWLCDHRYDQLCIDAPPTLAGISSRMCCLMKPTRVSLDLATLQWLHEVNSSVNVFDATTWPASRGDLAQIRWLHEHHSPETFSQVTVEEAVRFGHLEVVQFFHEHGYDQSLSSDLLSIAVGRGHLHVAEYLRNLHGYQRDKDFKEALQDPATRHKAMENAVFNGHLEVVQWLGRLGPTRDVQLWALQGAVSSGSLALIKWVYDHGLCGQWSSRLLAFVAPCAAKNADIHVLEWVDGLSPHIFAQHADIMCQAAKSGHLAIVKWLHEYTASTCMSGVIDAAARSGNLALVKWLHENRTERVTITAMQDAVRSGGSVAICLWLSKQGENGDLKSYFYKTRCYSSDSNSQHPNSMATSPMLAAVAYMGRSVAHLSALDHVQILVSEFLDASALFTLPRAASTGRVSLFRRVLARVLEAPDTDRHLLFHWLGQSLLKGIEGGHLPIVKLTHEAHPAALAVASFSAAAASGRLEILQWLCEHRYDQLCIEEPPARRGLHTMRCCLSYQCKGAAMINSRLEVLRWLYESGCVEHLREVGDLAAAQGDIEMVQWLHTLTVEGVFTIRAMEHAAKNGHLEIVQFLHNNGSVAAAPNTLMRAMVSGHEEVATFLKMNGVCNVIDPEALALMAAEVGRLDLLQEFSAFVDDDATRRNAMEAAVANGHVHVAEWLGHRWVSERALSGAAAQGHLSVLQLVHERSSGDWTPEVMAQAAMFGHLHVIQWFVENKPQLLDSVIVDCAAATGHLEIVKWLHEHCDAPCTTEAMDAAAANGEFEVVRWLSEHRTEGCTMAAIQMAAQHGHLELVIWLHKQGYAGLTSSQMRPVPLDVAKWIHDTMGHPIDVSAAVRSVATGDMAYLRWIHENSTLRASPQIIGMVLPMAHAPMIEWMRANRPEEFAVEE